MSDLISSLTSLFAFLFTQMANFADFLTDNVLGQVILGLVVFPIIIGVGVDIFKHFHK